MPLSRLRQYLLQERYSDARREGERLVHTAQLADEELAQAYKGLAMAHYYLGELFAAVKLGERAHEVALRTENRELIGKTLYDLGEYYLVLGDYPEAHDHLMRFLTDLDRHPSLSWLEAWAHHNLGLIFRFQRQYDAALASHHLAADLHRQHGDTQRMLEVMRGIVWCYLTQGKADEAWPYLNQIESYLRSHPNEWLAASLLTDYAFYYQQTGDLTTSMAYCEKALTPGLPGANDNILATACLIAGENAVCLNRLQEARIFTNLAEEYALRAKRPALMNRATALRRRLHELDCSPS